MERKKASDFPPEVLRLFDGYVHGSKSRREFLDEASKFAVGGMTAAVMLQSLQPNFAWAQQVKKDDPRIQTEYKGRDLFAKQDTKKRIEDLVTGVSVLKARPECSGKIGTVGFCFGGGIVNLLATRLPDLGAGVAYYGVQPAASDVPKIKAALMIQNASDDPRINDGWPPYEAALKANQVRYEYFSYPSTQHGFHNDTTPRYDEAAAKLSWQRTVDFFNQHLR